MLSVSRAKSFACVHARMDSAVFTMMCEKVTCFVTYKTSTKIISEGMRKESDIRQALLASPFKELVNERLLIQVSYYI